MYFCINKETKSENKTIQFNRLRREPQDFSIQKYYNLP